MPEQRKVWWIRDSKFCRKASPYYTTADEAKEALKRQSPRRRYSIDEGLVDVEEIEVPDEHR